MPQGVDALLLAQSLATPDRAFLGAAFGVIGSTLGSLVLYYIGRLGGRQLLMGRGRWYSPRISEASAVQVKSLMGDWGAALLVPVVMTPLPLPMKPVVLAAGMFQMPVLAFTTVVVLSRSVRYFGVVFLALRYGDQALDFALDHLHLAAIGCLLCVAACIAVHRLGNRWIEGRA